MPKVKNEAVAVKVAEVQEPATEAAPITQSAVNDPVVESISVEELPAPVQPSHISPNPTLGRIVIFKLSEQHAAEINRRRTTPYSIGERIKLNCNSQTLWPIGAQAHIGNEVSAGDEFPMTVVRLWGGSCVNGQVLLDGYDTYWATSVSEGEHNGMWHWPVRG